jgi:hypothetical protein
VELLSDGGFREEDMMAKGSPNWFQVGAHKPLIYTTRQAPYPGIEMSADMVLGSYCSVPVMGI